MINVKSTFEEIENSTQDNLTPFSTAEELLFAGLPAEERVRKEQDYAKPIVQN